MKHHPMYLFENKRSRFDKFVKRHLALNGGNDEDDDASDSEDEKKKAKQSSKQRAARG